VCDDKVGVRGVGWIPIKCPLYIAQTAPPGLPESGAFVGLPTLLQVPDSITTSMLHRLGSFPTLASTLQYAFVAPVLPSPVILVTLNVYNDQVYWILADKI